MKQIAPTCESCHGEPVSYAMVENFPGEVAGRPIRMVYLIGDDCAQRVYRGPGATSASLFDLVYVREIT